MVFLVYDTRSDTILFSHDDARSSIVNGLIETLLITTLFTINFSLDIAIVCWNRTIIDGDMVFWSCCCYFLEFLQFRRHVIIISDGLASLLIVRSATKVVAYDVIVEFYRLVLPGVASIGRYPAVMVGLRCVGWKWFIFDVPIEFGKNDGRTAPMILKIGEVWAQDLVYHPLKFGEDCTGGCRDIRVLLWCYVLECMPFLWFSRQN